MRRKYHEVPHGDHREPRQVRRARRLSQEVLQEMFGGVFGIAPGIAADRKALWRHFQLTLDLESEWGRGLRRALIFEATRLPHFSALGHSLPAAEQGLRRQAGKEHRKLTGATGLPDRLQERRTLGQRRWTALDVKWGVLPSLKRQRAPNLCGGSLELSTSD